MFINDRIYNNVIEYEKFDVNNLELTPSNPNDDPSKPFSYIYFNYRYGNDRAYQLNLGFEPDEYSKLLIPYKSGAQYVKDEYDVSRAKFSIYEKIEVQNTKNRELLNFFKVFDEHLQRLADTGGFIKKKTIKGKIIDTFGLVDYTPGVKNSFSKDLDENGNKIIRGESIKLGLQTNKQTNQIYTKFKLRVYHDEENDIYDDENLNITTMPELDEYFKDKVCKLRFMVNFKIFMKDTGKVSKDNKTFYEAGLQCIVSHVLILSIRDSSYDTSQNNDAFSHLYTPETTIVFNKKYHKTRDTDQESKVGENNSESHRNHKNYQYVENKYIDNETS